MLHESLSTRGTLLLYASLLAFNVPVRLIMALAGVIIVLHCAVAVGAVSGAWADEKLSINIETYQFKVIHFIRRLFSSRSQPRKSKSSESIKDAEDGSMLTISSYFF
jgi:hypothetical protein